LEWRRMSRGDRRFLLSLIPFPLILLGVLLSMLAVFIIKSLPILEKEGLSVFTTNVWRASETNPAAEQYGLLAAIWGSVYTGIIAVLVGGALSIGFAVTVEELAGGRIRELLSGLMDMMAATPTIIYGLWGVVYLAPLLRNYVYLPLHRYLGWLPFFQEYPTTGYTIGTAGVLLGIMITPYAAMIIREAYASIPFSLREAAYGIGATRFEAIRLQLGLVKPAVISALVLGYGRAIGETVAVALVVGNCRSITLSITAPGITVASLIASMFKAAAYYHYMESALYAGGLALFLIGLAVNLAGLYLVRRWEEKWAKYM